MEPALHKNPAIAVLFIHGIGEQKPMDTLRGFVKAIKNCLEKSDPREKYIPLMNKPDYISGNNETRILRLPKTRKRKRIDFYEFYWANMMKDTQTSYFIGWIIKLIFKTPQEIPKNLRKVWYTIWGILIIAILLSVYYAAYKLSLVLIPVILITGIGLIFPIIKIVFKNILTQYVGDAGRYFMPSPANIDVRYKIRKRGLELLRELHNEDRYSRIIVVGHSLGSVIGYDLLRLLWPEYSEIHEVGEMDKTFDDIIEQINSLAIGKEEFDIKKYQDLQSKCLKEQNKLGQKWITSDFITIGSPLLYLDYLTTKDVELKTSIIEREFPSCPPVADENKKADKENYNIYYINNKNGVKTLHHAGLFALTRWTNIYFDKDPVGGPARDVFKNYIIQQPGNCESGKAISDGVGGILDIEIKSKFSIFKLGGHTKYWNLCTKEECNGCNCTEPIGYICRALRLYAKNE